MQVEALEEAQALVQRSQAQEMQAMDELHEQSNQLHQVLEDQLLHNQRHREDVMHILEETRGEGEGDYE